MYKITINGVHCITQTYDNMLNTDGWADEVYLTWSVARKVGSSAVTNSAQSVIYGDVAGRGLERKKAGDATAAGGIRSANYFPLRFGRLPNVPEWVPPLPLPMWSDKKMDGFPWVMFNDNLRAGEVLAIAPLVWEWDGDEVNPGPTLDAIGEIAVKAAAGVTALNPIAGVVVAAVGGVLKLFAGSLGTARNRPIGMDISNPDSATSVSWPEILVSDETIDSYVTMENGYGPGIFRYSQRDPAGIGAGEYAFWVQFSKI